MANGLRPYANTVKAIVASIVFEATLFAGAVYREISARDRPMRSAIETGFIVVGYGALLFGFAVFLQWRADRIDRPKKSETDERFAEER